MSKGLITGLVLIGGAVTIGIIGYKKGWWSKAKPSVPVVNAPSMKPTITQKEADSILADANEYVKKQNELFGGLTKLSMAHRDEMLDALYKGGYKIENGKAVPK